MQDLAINDYKTILKEELASRCRQNPRYSLRAFARDLKLAPSRLSEVLSGKQGLSRPAAERIAKSLGYAAGDIERFCDLVESLHARSKKNRDSARLRLKKVGGDSSEIQLQADTVKLIADWYHFAILELTNLDGFRSESKWIAKRLGISEFEAQLALDRLQRLNLITRKGDEIKLNHQHGFHASNVSTEAINTFLGQLMAKARDALYFQQVERSEINAEIVAIDRAKIPEAKKMIRDFRHKFCRKLGEDEVRDGLYCIAIQFFELTERG